MKRLVFLLLSMALLCFLEATPVLAGNPAPKIDFTARPLGASRIDSSITSYFLDEGPQGQVLNEVLTVSNNTGKPIFIDTRCVEARNGINGGIVYAAEKSSNTWITDLPDKISLGANETKNVDFRIAIPGNAAGGDHVFGIVLQDHSPEAVTSQDYTQMSITVNEQVNRVIGVQVEVPGDRSYKLTLDKANVSVMPSGAYLTIEGMNLGNSLTVLEGRISLYKGNSQVWSIAVDNAKFLPGRPVEFQYPWTGGAPELGDYRVVVNLEGSGAGTLSKVLKFGVTADSLQHYGSLAGHQAVQAYIPSWIYLVGAILICALIILIFAFFKLRKSVNSNNSKPSL